MLCQIASSKLKQKKALMWNVEKALPQWKITKRNKIIPSHAPPHLADPSFVEFVVTSEYNSKFKLEIPALHRASEHISSFESGTFQEV